MQLVGDPRPGAQPVLAGRHLAQELVGVLVPEQPDRAGEEREDGARRKGLPAADGRIEVHGVSCLGQCDRPVAVSINDHVFAGRPLDELKQLVRSLDGWLREFVYEIDFADKTGEDRNFVAALDTTTGVVDPAWDPDANSVVRALALTAGGSVLLSAVEGATLTAEEAAKQGVVDVMATTLPAGGRRVDDLRDLGTRQGHALGITSIRICDNQFISPRSRVDENIDNFG